jgi:hypothetical protein
MVYKKDKLMALLPANKIGNDIHSHQGLSYGGLILNNKTKFHDILKAFTTILQFLQDNSFNNLKLMPIPRIYHSTPSDEVDYLLFILEAKITKKEALSVVEPIKSVKSSPNRMEGVKRGQKHNLIVKETNSFDDFWKNILSVNLMEKFATKPVHSLEEITRLKSSFPNNIQQFNVYHGDKLVAGTTIFESKNVAHCQYISANEDKNTLGSLDFLHHHLITNVFKDKPYYDFGSSNEHDGKQINEGLQYWKEGFGARTIIQEFYSIKTKNANLLNDILK